MRRRDLEGERGGQQRAQAGPPAQARRPRARPTRRSAVAGRGAGPPAAGEHDREVAARSRGRRRRDQRGPVPRQGEVGQPGGVVDAGQRRP